MNTYLRQGLLIFFVQIALAGSASPACLECNDGGTYMPITIYDAYRNFWSNMDGQPDLEYVDNSVQLLDVGSAALLPEEVGPLDFTYFTYRFDQCVTLPSPAEFKVPVTDRSNPVVTVHFAGSANGPEEWSDLACAEGVDLAVGGCFTKVKITGDGSWTEVSDESIHWEPSMGNAKIEPEGITLEITTDEPVAYCAAMHVEGGTYIIHRIALTRGYNLSGEPVCQVTVERLVYDHQYDPYPNPGFPPDVSDFSIEFMTSQEEKEIGE